MTATDIIRHSHKKATAATLVLFYDPVTVEKLAAVAPIVGSLKEGGKILNCIWPKNSPVASGKNAAHLKSAPGHLTCIANDFDSVPNTSKPSADREIDLLAISMAGMVPHRSYWTQGAGTYLNGRRGHSHA